MVTGERNYTVKLMLQSSPAPTLYTWTFNGSLLSSGDGITLGADFITFAVVSERNSGEYTVSGSNGLGTDTVSFSLVVLPFPATTITETVPTTQAVPNITATAPTTADVTDAASTKPTPEAFEVLCSHVVKENTLSVSCSSDNGLVEALLCSYDNDSAVTCGKLSKDTSASLL